MTSPWSACFIAAAGVVLASVGCSAAVPFENDQTVRVVVEKVGMLAAQSYPVRMTLVVSGKSVPGVPIDVTQERHGNDVVVTLTQATEGEPGAAWESFEKRIPLEGGFASGHYTLKVNDYASEFDV